MKYLKLSSVLVALFFAVGCGSKTVDATGGTSAKTIQQQPVDTIKQDQIQLDDTATIAPDEEVIAANDLENMNGTNYGPEGAFMPGPNPNYYDDNETTDENNMVNNGQNLNDENNNEMEVGDAFADENNMVNNGQNTYAQDSNIMILDALKSIYFDFDRYNIREDMKDYIRANAEYIKAQNIQAVVLQGHTDEFGGDEYNTALGLKRAISVRDALILQGLPKSMFSTISYGMHKPVCKEKTSACYAKNRRTDLIEN